MSEQVIIDRRFRGPPDSGNGGYVCGIVAGFIGDTAEVTLRRPPPLEKVLAIERLEHGGVALRDGEALVAEGSPTTIEVDIPAPVSFAEATRLGGPHPTHPSPGCFTCGPQRGEGDGLRIFPGPVDGRDIVAAPWTPDPSLADDDGRVRPEFVWAALDCPGGFAVGFPDPRSVLGRLAVKVMGPVRRDERYVVVGWPVGGEGRKLYAGSALFSQDGTVHAIASATWVKIDTP